MATALDDLLTGLIATLYRRRDFAVDSLHDVVQSLAIMLRFTRLRNDELARQVASMVASLATHERRLERLECIVDGAGAVTETDLEVIEEPAWGELTLVRRRVDTKT